MTASRFTIILICLACTLAWCTPIKAQETGKSSDEALDSLLEKLSEPGAKTKKIETSAGKPAKEASQRPKSEAAKKAATSKPKPDSPPQAKTAAKQAGKPAKPSSAGSSDVSSKDKELDQLLEKLGETRDEPAAEDRTRGRRPPGEEGEPSQPSTGKGDQAKSKPKPGANNPGLEGKDKELDERLEEFAGKKRKKNRSDEQAGTGQLGQIIKEMRDVEQRLEKPDTSEDTQGKQKQIVKKIETLIEQIRQSSSSGMAMRQVKQPGGKPGNQQPGQTPGANAQGAPPTKPAKPSDRHSPAGGKEIWGHLPDELRQEMENVFKEDALATKEDLIRRYYLSVSKRKLVREE
jgi:hypothetical protein